MLISKVILLSVTAFSSLAMADISGLYQSACQPASEPGLSVRNNVNFGKINARQVQVIYGDETCTTAAWALDFRGPYTLSDAGELDLSVTSMNLVPLDANVALTFNQIGFCGMKNWQLNKPKNIGGVVCQDRQFPAPGFTSFELIKEVENGIVFGAISQELDGSTADKRPLGFDDANVFEAVLPATGN